MAGKHTEDYEVKTNVETHEVEIILTSCQNQEEKDPSNDTEVAEFDAKENTPRNIDCEKECEASGESGFSKTIKTRVGLFFMLLVAFTGIAVLSYFLVTKSKKSKNEQQPCQEDALRTHSWEP